MNVGSPTSAAFVGGYRAVAHLRREDLYDVYDAWSEERDARCVVKILRPERRPYPVDRRRVALEGELLLSLTHPHIVRAYEAQEDPIPFIVLEANTGATVASLVEHGPVPLRDLARLATQMCSAVGYLHRRGYLHLDLGPSKVTWDRGFVRLVDLSSARRPGPAVGESLSEATDLWGLGCILYEAATGRAPFGENGMRAGGEIPAPLKKNGRLRPATGSIIMRCLSPASQDRPALSEVARIFAPLV